MTQNTPPDPSAPPRQPNTPAPNTAPVADFLRNRWNRYASQNGIQNRPDVQRYLRSLGYAHQGAEARRTNTTFVQPTTILPTFWEVPQNIARMKNTLDTLPPGASAPNWIDPQGVNSAYEWISTNYGPETDKWPEDLGEFSPISDWLRSLTPPPATFDVENAQATLFPTEPAASMGQQPIFEPLGVAGANPSLGFYRQPNTTEGGLAVPGVTDASREAFNSQLGAAVELLGVSQGAPGFQKFIADWVTPAVGVVGGALPLAFLGGLLGVPGFLIGGAIGIGGSVAAMLTEQKRQQKAMEQGSLYKPGVLTQILNVFDIPALWVEQLAGTTWQLVASSLAPEDYGSVQSVLQNLPAAWEASRGFYENLILPVGLGKDEYEVGGRDVFRTYEKGANGDWQTISWRLPEGVDSAPAFLLSQAADQIGDRLMNGERPKDVYMDIEQQYYDVLGSAAAARDLVGHIILDPLNLTNTVFKRVGMKVMAKKGNLLGAEAFMLGRGEAIQTARIYGALLQQGITTPEEALKLARWERWLGGFDENGQSTILKPRVLSKNKLKAIFQSQLGFTPEAQADMVITNSLNNVRVMLSEARDVDEIKMLLQGAAQLDPQLAAAATAKAPWLKAPIGQVFVMATRDLFGKDEPLSVLISSWNESRGVAAYLDRIASVLGESTHDMLKEIKQHGAGVVLQRFFTGLEEMANKGDQSALTLLNQVRGKLTPEQLEAHALPFIKGTIPLTFDNMRAAVANVVMERIGKWAADYYGVKPTPLALQVSNLIRQVQSLILLGTSPSYAFQNLYGNVVTMAYSGIYGTVSMNDIRRFNEEWMGVTPARLEAGAGPAAALGQNVASKEIRAAARPQGNGILSKLNDILSRANRSMVFTPMMQMSQRFEQMNSAQAVHNGMVYAWNRLWKPGTGFDRMPPVLEAALADIDPALPGAVYAAIQGGAPSKDLVDALWAEVKGKPANRALRSFVADAAQRGEITDPDGVLDMMRQLGIEDRLNQALKDAKTPEEAGRALDLFQEDVIRAMTDEIAKHQKDIAENAMTRGAAEGPQAALEVADFFLVDIDEFWSQHFQDWGEVMIQLRGTKDRATRNRIIYRQRQESGSKWYRITEIQKANMVGLLRGLQTDETHVQRMTIIMDRIAARWQRFYNEVAVIQERFDPTGMKPDEFRTASDAIKAETDAMYKSAFDEVAALYDESDQLFLQAYQTQFDMAGPAAEAWRKGVKDARKAMHDAIQKAKKEINALGTQRERNMAWDRFWNGEYRTLTQKLMAANLDGAKKMFVEIAGQTGTPTLTPGTTKPVNYTIRQMNDLFYQYNIPRSEIQYMLREINQFVPDGEPKFEMIDLMVTPSEAAYKRLEAALAKWDADRQTRETARPTPPPPPAPAAGAPVEPAPLGAPSPMIMTAFSNDDYVPETVIFARAADIPGSSVGEEYIVRITKARASGRKGRAMIVRVLDDADPRIAESKFGEISETFKDNTLQERLDAIFVANSARRNVVNLESLREEDVLAMGFSSKLDAKNRVSVGLGKDVHHLAEITLEDLKRVAPKVDEIVDDAQAQVGQALDARRKAEQQLGYQSGLSGADVRAAFLDDAQEIMGLSKEEATAVIALMDGRAGVWARKNGSTADTWWSNNIAGIIDSVDEYVRSKYFKAQAPAQGASTLLNDGRTLISALIKPNVTTLVHEVAHIFFRELDDAERKIFSDWYMQQYQVKVTWDGTKFVPETPGAKLVAGWIRGKPELSVEDHMAEAFAYGYENHIHRGVRSETPVGIAAVYEALSGWFRDIYKKIVGSNISVPISDEVRKMMDGLVDDGYEPRRPAAEPEVAPGGPRVEAPERTPEIERAVEDAVIRTSDDLATGRSTGLADAVRVGDGDVDSITRRKDTDVIASLGVVRSANPIDDDVDAVPFQHIRKPLSERPLGAEVEGYEGDPNKTFKMHYQVVDLYDIMPSHDELGRRFSGYPKGMVYQMRGRGRKAYVVELDAIAGKFKVDVPLETGPSISTGSIVVDRRGFVLSGNGRTAVWYKLLRDKPKTAAKYVKELRKRIAQYGLDESALEGIENPILVRVLDDGQDVADFTYLANQGAVSRMSPVEKALSDARWIDRRMMVNLDIGDEETIEEALGRISNNSFVTTFMNSLPRTERNELVNSKGEISPAGIKRIANAIFARLFAGRDGEEMLEASLESTDPGIKAVRTALNSSLGQIASMEERVKTGLRNRGLTIVEDVGAVINLLSRVKKKETTVAKFLNTLAQDEIGMYSPFQVELARYIEENSNKSAVLRRFFRDYADGVIAEPAPGEEAGLFGEHPTRTRGEILDDIVDAPTINALVDEAMKQEAAAGRKPRPRQEIFDEIQKQRDDDGTATTRFFAADTLSKSMADQAYGYAAIRTYGSVGDAIQALTWKANNLELNKLDSAPVLKVIAWLQDEAAKSGNDALVQRAIDDGRPKSFFQRPLAETNIEPETLDGMRLFAPGDDPLFQRGLQEDYGFLGDEWDSNDFRVGFRKAMVEGWGIKDDDLLDSIMFMMDSLSVKWARKYNRPATEYWTALNGSPNIVPPKTNKGTNFVRAYEHGMWDKGTDYGPFTIGLEGIPVGDEQGFANFSFMHEVAHASKQLLDGNEMGLVIKWLSDAIGSDVIYKAGHFQQIPDSSKGGPSMPGLYVYSRQAEELWATAVSAYLQGGPLPNNDMRVPFARFREAIREGMVRFSAYKNAPLVLYDEYPNRFNAAYYLHQTEIPAWITPIFQDMFGTANPRQTDGLTPGNPFIRYSKRITYDDWMDEFQDSGGAMGQLDTDEQLAAFGFTAILNLLPEPHTMTEADFMRAAAHVRDLAGRVKQYTLDVVLKDASEKVRNETIRDIDARMKSISDEDFLRRYYKDQVLDAIDKDYVLDAEILDENPAFRRGHQDAIRIRNDRLEQVRGSTLYQTAPDTPEFREWFGDSEVVDEEGKPKTFYHGTPAGAFEYFDEQRADTNALYGPGFYFTDNPAIASGYAETRGPAGMRMPEYRVSGAADLTPGEVKALTDWLFDARIKMQLAGDALGENEARWLGRDIMQLVIQKDGTGNLYKMLSYADNPNKRRLLVNAANNILGADKLIEIETGEVVIPVFIKAQKLFDVEKMYSFDDLFDMAGNDPEKQNIVYRLEAAALGLTPELWDRGSRINKTQLGITRSTKMSGDQLYKSIADRFMSQGGISRKEMNEMLRALGFDGITHPGGAITGNERHQVVIVFSPKQVKSAYNRTPTSDFRLLYQTSSQNEPWYYSPLMRTITSMPQAKMPVEQFRAWLKGRAKADELRWTGFDEWLDQQTGTVTRQDMLDYLQENQVTISETVKGADPDYERTMNALEAEHRALQDEADRINTEFRSGVSYRNGEDAPQEVIERATAIQNRQIAIENQLARLRRGNITTQYEQYALPGRMDYHELLLTYASRKQDAPTRKLKADFERMAQNNLEVQGRLISRREKLRTQLREYVDDPRNNVEELDVQILALEEKIHNENLAGEETQAAIHSWYLLSERRSSILRERDFMAQDINEINQRLLQLNSEYIDLLNTIRYYVDKPLESEDTYRSPHWSERNVLAHIRFDSRVDADGRRVLFVEEVQSDWHQAGRKYGYKSRKPVKVEVGEPIVTHLAAGDTADGVERWKVTSSDGHLTRYIVKRTTKKSNQFVVGKVYPPEPMTGHLDELFVTQPYGPEGTWDIALQEPGNPRLLLTGQTYLTEQAALNRIAEWKRDADPFETYYEVAGDYFDTLEEAIRETKSYIVTTHERFVNEMVRNTDGRKPPEGPFAESWETLAMRRVIRWAAENGYDRVAWTTGKIQSDRYNLAAVIDEIIYSPKEKLLTGMRNGFVEFTHTVEEADLPDYIGEEATKKLLASDLLPDYGAGESHHLSGAENLSVGSQGMVGFYDQKLPSVVRKIIKPWGVDVGETLISTIDAGFNPSSIDGVPPEYLYRIVNNNGDQYAYTLRAEEAAQQLRSAFSAYPNGEWYIIPPEATGFTVPSFDITPEMRQSVMQGQPLFQTASGDHVRVEPINGEQHAGLDIVANVYATDEAGEKLVAYMPNTYRLGGWVGEGANRYRILGVSTDKEGKYWIVERGDNTLTTVERKPETVAVNAPLGAAQQFQTAPPSAQMSSEGYNEHLRPVLNKVRSYYTDPANWKSNKFSKLQATLPPDVDRQMRAYLAKVQGQRSSAKLATIRYGEMQRDFALLNYGAQRGFDNWLSALFPYQFWYTRSAWHWLQRFADRPSILSKYYQLRTYGERTENDPSFPQRLKGKVAMPVPFLPEETGGTMWIDPLKQIFPFETFARPLDMLKQDQNVLQRAAASVIYGWINDGTVSKEVGMQAINSMSGTLWEKAYAAAKMDNEDQLNGGYDIMASLMSPNLPLNYLIQILKGTPERINQLPFTRGLQAMTSLLNIGKPGGVNLAESINVAGFPSVDRFYEYRVDRELSNMAAEGQITAQTAIEAMINRSGPAFDQATTRSGKLTGWKWVYAVMFPDFYTLGEQKQRQLSKEFKEAMDAWAAGKSEKIQAFYEDHPEYEARMSSLDDPEVRLRGFVIDRIWEAYKSKNSAEKKAYVQSFGKVFQQNFLDKETQDYDTIDTPTLLAWAKALGQNQLTVQKESPTLNVNLPDPESSAALDAYYKELNEKFPNIQARLDKYFATSEAARTTDPVVWSYTRWKDKYLAEHPNIIQYVQSEQSSLAGMTMEQQQVIYQYRAAKMQKFPNIDFLQDQYFKLDTTKRRAFLKDNPSLADYWDWRKSYAADYPSVATYILGQDKVSDLIRGTSGDIPLDIQKYIDAYYGMRDQYFPNMDALQDQYFKLQDTAQRKSFRKAHPEMLAYWDWRREWAAQYPKAAVYILGEDSLANYILGDSYGRVQVKRDDLSQPLQNQLAQYFSTSQGKLSGPAREAINNIWIKMGKPGADLDEFIDLYIRPLFIGG